MNNCVFCKIVAKEIPADLVYEDDTLIAFNDIRPAAPVHFLIIPKQHVDSLSNCSEAHAGLLGKMLSLVPTLAEKYGCAVTSHPDGTLTGGYKTQINTGPDGGQEVYHLHVHVMCGARAKVGQ